jgi:HEAT repeat protein
MKRQTAWTFAFLLLVAAGVALAVPGSPVYLPKLLKPPALFEGHPIPYWVSTALDSPDVEERRKAVRALGVVGIEGEDTVPALARVMTQDTDNGARVEASLALTRIDTKAPALTQALPALTQALEDKELAVRMNAAIALRRLATAARPAVPALIKAVQDKTNDSNCGLFHFTIKEIAAMALGQASAGTDEAVPLLRELLASAKTADSRQFRVRALGFVGPQARPALPEIRTMLKNSEPQVRAAAEEAIQNIEKGEAPEKGP